jgi:radical SAM-linked protein
LSEPRYDSAFEAVLAGIRQPARLIGEEAGAGPGFTGAPSELRVVLGFPDTYEIAISNQAVQILYHLARRTEGVGVERAYLPWVDAITAMREAGVPLLTLETWTPVAEAHLLGVTLQHEFHYTNLLEMLDLAGMPLHAEERSEEHPLVLVGGPACANFAPISRFVDAVAVGDGEEVFPEILAVMVEARKAGASRVETKRLLSGVEGVFVPGVSSRVTRQAVRRLEGSPYPTSGLVPLVAGVHDRAWVEVMRGCTRGCRFCQAGMWYRPVRERPAAEVLQLATDELAATGHRELAFASLSTTDYSCLQDVLVGVAATHPEVSVSLPSLRVDNAAVRLAWLASPTGNSLTLAPEAGSQRMRDIVNKNVTEDDILAAAEEAFRGGRSTLKLYFMIGLPLETDDDVAAIADLCLRIRDIGRRTLGGKASRLQLNVSVNTFIPKPFTPFQWAPITDRETVRRRQELLRARLRKPGIRLSMSSPDKSYLEATLARGGEETGAIIEAAWRKGARFDPWTEQFKPVAWAEAFREQGTSPEELATVPLPRSERLPWDVVDGVPDVDFLWGEWEKASRGEVTGDCRWDGCGDCGACAEPPGNKLATPGAPVAPAEAPGAALGAIVAAEWSPTVEGPPAGPAAQPAPLRYVARFSVTGRGRFLGHLDRMEAFRRAVRRAGGHLALSAGMRPKAQLTLVLPLGVGVQGLEELCEFDLAEDPGDGFAERLGAALPGHMRLLDLRPYTGHRRLAARVIGATYRVAFVAGEAGAAAGGLDARAALAGGAERFAQAAEWTVEEMREDRPRVVDVKRFVKEIGLRQGSGGEWYAEFTAAVTPTGTARPELVMRALGQASALSLASTETFRTGIVLDRE